MNNENKKGSKLTMRLMLILFSMVPLVLVMLAMIIIAYNLMTNNLEDQTKETLKVSVEGLKQYYEYDIAENGDVPYEWTYVDSLKSEDVDLTVFKDNIRYITSILDAQTGKRIEGTEASDAVWKTVGGGSDYYSDDVVIQGKDYYVYYKPMYGPDGKVWGMAFAGKPCTKVKESQNSMLLMLTLIGLGIGAVCAIAAICLAAKVANPIKIVATKIKTASDGDLDDNTEATARIDETKVLLESTATLQNVLKEVIGKTKDASGIMLSNVNSVFEVTEEASGATSQISTAMGELATGSALLAENVQDINGKVIDMGDLIGNITQNANTLNDSSKNMSAANEDATGYINKMLDSSVKSVKAVQDISAQVIDTNEAISQINEAVSIITGIAGQTNLLALNASIEAARAGEQGRGFAVVADEIKQLAEQSNNSAEGIRRTVDGILVKSEHSVNLAKTVEDIISEEQRLLDETKQKFEELNREINNSVEEITSINSMTEELDQIKSVIIANISDLSAVSEENSASNQEVSASIDGIADNINNISSSMGDLKRLADELDKSVSYFK